MRKKEIVNYSLCVIYVNYRTWSLYDLLSMMQTLSDKPEIHITTFLRIGLM